MIILSLVFCYDVSRIWCKEEYRFVAEKIRERIQNSEDWEYGILEEVNEEQRKGSMCQGEVDAAHIFLDCIETRKLREELLRKKWLVINEKLEYGKSNKLHQETSSEGHNDFF
jgi:hypothetical protein